MKTRKDGAGAKLLDKLQRSARFAGRYRRQQVVARVA